MNYDLCDLLNRKLENYNGYMAEDFPSKSICKNQNILDESYQAISSEDYLETVENDNCDHQCFSFWLYRNGKVSDQIDDFDKSARKITRELANMSFSNSPALDIMYFSGCTKVYIAKNKSLLIETCIRPSLDQMFTIKDFERMYLNKCGKVIWRIIERKKKSFFEGIGSNSLHDFKWSRIK